jgi:hypothetical protein
MYGVKVNTNPSSFAKLLAINFGRIKIECDLTKLILNIIQEPSFFFKKVVYFELIAHTLFQQHTSVQRKKSKSGFSMSQVARRARP